MDKVQLSTDRIPELIGSNFLNLILFPTEKCNFRCNYCYEDFKIGKMSVEVLNGVKSILGIRIPELDVLEISWFGGEPLLGMNIIEDVSLHILELQKEHSKLKYKSNITTNGFYLSKTNFEKLVSFGITHFQITLDGDFEMHDLTTNVPKSFEKIWRNLLEIRKIEYLNFTIELRLHYCPDTWFKLKNLISLINTTFGDDNRFKVYFKSLERYGGFHDNKIKIFDHSTNKRIKTFLDSKLICTKIRYNVPHQSNFICYAAKGTSFGIRANGDVVKCTVALNDERNKIGKIDYTGNLNINSDRFMIWLQGLFTGDRAFLQCPNSQLRPKLKCDFITIEEDEIVNKWNSI